MDMKLYHYSTWQGQRIFDDQKVFASVSYERFTGGTVLFAVPLIFLTSNPGWEPSVQARSVRLFWEKCGSCPEVYEELGIPCWRFLIGYLKHLKPVRALDYSTSTSWRRMLEDAILMGSDPEQWYICGSYMDILESWKWEKGKWTTPTN